VHSTGHSVFSRKSEVKDAPRRSPHETVTERDRQIDRPPRPGAVGNADPLKGQGLERIDDSHTLLGRGPDQMSTPDDRDDITIPHLIPNMGQDVQ
jgi:hypothetical protein